MVGLLSVTRNGRIASGLAAEALRAVFWLKDRVFVSPFAAPVQCEGIAQADV